MAQAATHTHPSPSREEQSPGTMKALWASSPRRCSQQLHHQRSRLPQGQLQGEPLQKSYLYLIHSPTKTRKPLRDVPTPSDSFLVAVWDRRDPESSRAEAKSAPPPTEPSPFRHSSTRSTPPPHHPAPHSTSAAPPPFRLRTSAADSAHEPPPAKDHAATNLGGSRRDLNFPLPPSAIGQFEP